VGLAALVIADAGSASQLAWLGAGLAALFLAVGVVGGWVTAVHTAIALLGTRTGAALAVAAIGACASAAAALALTAAPGRSVTVTALGALVAVAAFAAIVRPARRRYGASDDGEPPGAPSPSAPSGGSISPAE